MRKILNIPFKVKEIDENGVFSGYGSVFGNIDYGRDMVIKGAFEKSLARHVAAGTMPLMFYSHHIAKESGEWFEVYEDERGLFCKGKLWIDGLNPDPDALKAYRGMKKEKGKMGLSIGYEIPKDGAEYMQDGDFWRLKELDIWEISATPFPMNDLARIESVKATKNIKTKREFEKFLQSQGFSKAAAVSITAGGYREQGEPAQKQQEIEELIKTITKNMRN